MLKIKPLNEWVLIRRDEISESSGGIVLPDQGPGREEVWYTGIVLAVGPGRVDDKGKLLHEMAVKEGQRVIYLNAYVERLYKYGFGKDFDGLVLAKIQDVIAECDKPMNSRIL